MSDIVEFRPRAKPARPLTPGELYAQAEAELARVQALMEQAERLVARALDQERQAARLLELARKATASWTA